MSAFIVEKETINKVVSRMLPDNAACEDGDELGHRLLAMNYAAIEARYGDPVPQSIGFAYQHKEYKPIDVCKAMHCLRYQCSEGDVLETDLYKELEASISQIQSEIVHDLPEWEAAHWG